MSLQPSVKRIAAALVQEGATLSVAESCTGGGIGASLTAVSGSSAWFAGGFITYSNRMKMDLLGVTSQTLARHGAVSAAVAGEMVAGVLQRCATEYALSVTGIAGPGGGSAQKPVGLVWIGTADRADIVTRRYYFSGNRSAVRRKTIGAALAQLHELF
ncbi:MAG: CinA family protein [Fibrobacterota bacterium]